MKLSSHEIKFTLLLNNSDFLELYFEEKFRVNFNLNNDPLLRRSQWFCDNSS